MIPWRVYYTDGATYPGSESNQPCDPWVAPIFGCQIIVERDADHGRRIVSGGDFYVWVVEEERWRACDQWGMIQYMAKPGPKRFMVGEMIASDGWNALMRRAMTDPDFPVKTGYSPYEAKGER